MNLTILFLFLKEKVYKKKNYKEGWEHISPPSLTFHPFERDANASLYICCRKKRKVEKWRMYVEMRYRLAAFIILYFHGGEMLNGRVKFWDVFIGK